MRGQGKKFFPDYEISSTALEATNKRPPLSSQVFVIFFISFFICGLIYSFYTTMPVIVEAQGKLESDKDMVPVKAQVAFTVDRLLVSENKIVKKGDVLVSSSESMSPTEMVKLKNYMSALRLIANRPYRDACANCTGTLQKLAHDYLQIHAEGDLQGMIQPINDISRDMMGSIQSYKNIEVSVADARMAIRQAKEKLAEIKKRHAEQMLAREVETYRSQVVSSQARINEKYESSLLAIRQQKSLLKARLSELESRLEKFGKIFTVVAPFDGKIANIKVKGVGELVSGGQTLMELAPLGSTLRAAMVVQNKDIAKIKKGDEVILTIDALPEIDYGMVTGRVKEISNAEQGPQGGPGIPNYELKVLLDRQSLQKGGQETPFILGMTAKGKIVVRYESILMKAYRSLFKIKKDFASE